jgi:hypothetical protein
LRRTGLALGLLLVCAVTNAFGADAAALDWTAEHGVVWRTAHATVRVDRTDGPTGPLFRFGVGPLTCLENARIDERSDQFLVVAGELAAPGGQRLVVRRRLQARSGPAGEELSETFEISGGKAVASDLEVVRPFSIQAELPLRAATYALPLRDGEFRQGELTDQGCVAEYKLGRWLDDKEMKTPELALPVICVEKTRAWQAAVCADPFYAARFRLASGSGGVTGECRYRYVSSTVALEEPEKRTFGFWIAPAPAAEPRLRGPIDAFFRLTMPDVPPGPDWLKDVYAVFYDYMNHRGEGWDKDMEALVRIFGPENAGHVAVCYHGWYDRIGTYCFDLKTKTFRERWETSPRPNDTFPVTKEQMKRQLGLAKSKGLRTFLYFGDGLSDDSAAPGYRADWKWVSPEGKTLGAWSPPRHGKMFIRNPAHPEVVQWHKDYLAALIREFGPAIDGFVWDETFFIGTGFIAAKPEPSYSDRAMMRLVRDLTAQVDAWDPRKAFLGSDNVGSHGCWGNESPDGVPGYSLVADGLWQDSACAIQLWPYALFPNWRNAYWSCHWFTFWRFDVMRTGMELYGTPVSFAAGYSPALFGESWGNLNDIRAPHEWTADEAVQFRRAFDRRKAAGRGQVRYLTVPWQTYGPEEWNTKPPKVVPPRPAGAAQRW